MELPEIQFPSLQTVISKIRTYFCLFRLKKLHRRDWADMLACCCWCMQFRVISQKSIFHCIAQILSSLTLSLPLPLALFSGCLLLLHLFDLCIWSGLFICRLLVLLLLLNVIAYMLVFLHVSPSLSPAQTHSVCVTLFMKFLHTFIRMRLCGCMQYVLHFFHLKQRYWFNFISRLRLLARLEFQQSMCRIKKK